MDKNVILLVEDTAVLAAEIEHLLKLHDYEVCSARNAHEALAALQRLTPDLILTDLLMPQMDGFEMVRRIKMQDALKDIPVIVLTARASYEIAETAASLGVSKVLSKPCKATALLAAIESLIS